MKTHTIKTPQAELLVVEHPESWGLAIGEETLLIYDYTKKTFGKIHTFNGHYTLLGKPDEITEDDAREFVQYLTRRDLTITPKNYLKGKDGRFEDITFAESLLSLLETEIYWVNPFRITGLNKEYIELEDWDKNFTEAEQKTFNRNRTLIFKKNK